MIGGALDRSLKEQPRILVFVKHLLIDFVIAQQSISVTDQSQSPLAAFKTSVPAITGKPVPAKMSGVL